MFDITENEAAREFEPALTPGVYRERHGQERILTIIDVARDRVLYVDGSGSVEVTCSPTVLHRDRIEAPFADAMIACAQEMRQAHLRREASTIERLARVLGELAEAAEREWVR